MNNIIIEKQNKEFYYKSLERTGLGDLYCDYDDALIIAGKVDENYIGYLIYFQRKYNINVCYQNIKEEYTKDFLDDAFNVLKEEENITTITFSTDLEYESDLFTISRDDIVYRIEKSTYDEYIRLLDKYKYILDSLNNKGYITLQYNETYKDEMIKVYRDHVKKDNCYMDDCLNGEKGKIIEELSFVTLYKNEVVSYIIITYGNEQDNSVMLRYLMAREDYRHTGVMLLPLQKFFETFYKSEYNRTRFTIEMKNKYSKQIVPKFPNLFEKRLSMKEYKYVKEQTQNS